MAGLSINVQQLYKTYHLTGKSVPVLCGIDLHVAAGERLAIVGSSGSGKSTLLQLLGTLDMPDSGHILFDGRSILGLPSADLALIRNRHIGFVFQFHHLLPEFSSLENVMMPALIARQKKNVAKQAASALLEEVGLSHRVNHRPGELSGGEQQRVALARALMMEPGVLLADEVTGNLDRTTASGIHELLLKINETKGVTLVIVTHHDELAHMMGRTIRLSQGRLQPAIGTP